MVTVADETSGAKPAFILDGEKIEEVNDFMYMYLGSKINTEVIKHTKIQRRISLAKSTEQKLSLV